VEGVRRYHNHFSVYGCKDGFASLADAAAILMTAQSLPTKVGIVDLCFVLKCGNQTDRKLVRCTLVQELLQKIG
jgi:hypothetical protein